MERLLTTKQLAEVLQVAPSTVYFWVHSGFIPYLKLGKCVRFNEKAVSKWVESRSKKGRLTYKIEI
ncbi:MAG: helix-turn-helix domain-containing protein [bacterium]